MNATPGFRPAIHFAAQKNWINDPNGLVFDAATGLYHLFFQHNPFGDVWGHMSWGHATSPDLLHWTELPIAIPEDERASIYSGSLVIDHAGTAGFGAGAWVACYTGCLRRPEGGQAQELAFSLDRGLTWTKYAGNPVLDLGLKEFRDPKVFWHEATGRWIMGVVLPEERRVAFYASANLRDWALRSHFGPTGCTSAIWECPDLIHFPDQDRWLLKVDTFEGHPAGSGAQCWVGRFDGEGFKAETEAFWADQGSDFYAALSFAGLAEGRAPVWLAWMNQHAYAKYTPTLPWRGAMSLPRELALAQTAEGWRLLQSPVSTEALRGTARHLAGAGLVDAAGDVLELHWELDPGKAEASTLDVRCGPGGESTQIGIDHRRGLVWIDRSRSGHIPSAAAWQGRREQAWAGASGPLALRVIVDRCSVEVFSGDGRVALTEVIYPGPASDGVAVLKQGSGDWLRSVLTLWPLDA
ncbi:glycoside hydrolase family 32 protein [Roseateles sp. NT4]|uniref:glycoside hydrolase family 32 protein n=1 Tax=Roseateles sp. NT4 TaxID=3453715 RepID=UPI003EEC3B1B